MFCPNCGYKNEEDASFCENCGTDLREHIQSETQNVNTEPVRQTPVQQNNTQSYSYQAPPVQPGNMNTSGPQDFADYKPISMWGYFGYEILFAIPIIGFVFLLVFSFGGTSNVNLKNFARSYFCFLIIVVILIMIFLSMIAAAGGIGMLFY